MCVQSQAAGTRCAGEKHMHRMWLVALACSIATIAYADGQSVGTRMRNVVFHLDHGVVLQVDDLAGQLVSRVSGKPPVFDDVAAYLVQIDSARVSMTPESLTNLMNNYVFAYAGAPLKDLKITIEEHELHQSGKLKKGVDVPFS